VALGLANQIEIDERRSVASARIVAAERVGVVGAQHRIDAGVEPDAGRQAVIDSRRRAADRLFDDVGVFVVAVVEQPSAINSPFESNAPKMM
jgi:hypothetical protein